MCWIDWRTFEVQNKQKVISFITSDKNWAMGHKVRHVAWDMLRERGDANGFEIMAHMSPPYEPSKNPYYETAMYSVAIENVSEDNWFTEKLIDCFATDTVPIYWGCPNLGWRAS
jgi:hypothetical protein